MLAPTAALKRFGLSWVRHSIVRLSKTDNQNSDLSISYKCPVAAHTSAPLEPGLVAHRCAPLHERFRKSVFAELRKPPLSRGGAPVRTLGRRGLLAERRGMEWPRDCGRTPPPPLWAVPLPLAGEVCPGGRRPGNPPMNRGLPISIRSGRLCTLRVCPRRPLRPNKSGV